MTLGTDAGNTIVYNKTDAGMVYLGFTFHAGTNSHMLRREGKQDVIELFVSHWLLMKHDELNVMSSINKMCKISTHQSNLI